MSIWPLSRARELEQGVCSLKSKGPIKVYFAPSSEAQRFDYFPKELYEDLAAYPSELYEFETSDPANANILIVTGHGGDLSAPLWELRQQGEEAIIAVWLWDNHVSYWGNLRTVFAADFVFPSHQFSAGLVSNPVSVLGPHIPACSAQWSIGQAKRIFSQHRVSRSDKLYAPYVGYPELERTRLLRRLATEMPEADVLLIDPDDRSQYFGKDRVGRMLEWMSHKVSLVLPVNHDLSTRLFDGLLSGQALVVAEDVFDLDNVISPDLQQELGIVRFKKHEPEEIRRAYHDALAIFDRDGEVGIKHRHEFVLGNHMLAHRVAAIADTILDVVSGEHRIHFRKVGDAAPGLVLGGTHHQL